MPHGFLNTLPMNRAETMFFVDIIQQDVDKTEDCSA